jgi:hypothetical protein
VKQVRILLVFFSLVVFLAGSAWMVNRMFQEERTVIVPQSPRVEQPAEPKTDTAGSSTDPPLEPLAGPSPPMRRPPSAPAHVPARSSGTPLTQEQLRKMHEEARRQAEASVSAKQKKQIEMFVDIIGTTLDESRAVQVRDVYDDYYTNAYRVYTSRVTEARRRHEEEGIDFEMPDKEKVYAEVRVKEYEKLEKILTEEEMNKFRTWWEDKCHPKRD